LCLYNNIIIILLIENLIVSASFIKPNTADVMEHFYQYFHQQLHAVYYQIIMTVNKNISLITDIQVKLSSSTQLLLNNASQVTKLNTITEQNCFIHSKSRLQNINMNI